MAALYFFVHSFLGWVCECIYCSIPAKKFINRGFLAGPYCPIYGCGALMVIHILEPWASSPIAIFLLGMVVTSALEYLTSYFMELLFHTKWWDYSTYPFNLNGRVCLKNSLMFAILCLIVMYGIHPLVLDLLSAIPLVIRKVLLLLLVLGFAWDILNTTRALLRKNKEFLEVEACLRELAEDFRKANLNPLKEGYGESLRKVLDSTNADEVLMKHMDTLRSKLESIHTIRRNTQERLSKAFPTRIEAKSRITAEKLISILNEYRKKDK